MRPAPQPRPRHPRRDPAQADTWARYRENVARYLIGLGRDYQNRVMSHLTDEMGFEGLRLSFGPLLSLVALQPRALTALANELSVSPQACSQLINLVEQAGYVERRADPADGRAKQIVLKPQGERLIANAISISREIESGYQALIGEDAYDRFVSALGSLCRGLGIPTHSGVSDDAESGQTAGVLPLLSVRIQQDLMTATIARGHAGLKMSYGQILPLIGPKGARVHEIAKLHRVTRQAISSTARDLEKLGYLRREPDSQDRRGVVLQLTAAGSRLIEDSVASLDALENGFSKLIGEAGWLDLEATALDLYQALQLEKDIFDDALDRRTRRSGSDDRGGAASERDIIRLADTLRRQLGERDTARLAALLESSPDAEAGTLLQTRRTQRGDRARPFRSQNAGSPRDTTREPQKPTKTRIKRRTLR